ncbi:phosphonate ABC transporter periplasmic phosphonate-binding protein [Hyphomonas polymorpha PS728]|uniref:Phosphonate ABC transporter periplasmic phosphonate-binding protein n=1 Tax=Hyphomonas polymorpha PS728 TaxID=1280954 RepID=A0A062V5F2_9PROT|nr:phosphate/phosphite/phosphonate ABC transporter substrate-binding protein [Hyphomonas polymorpha]KCZ97204.1 phosphonate ABC transporter periplasmic phosphonate-binding protein [Hyphomonas polymorpha PS728]
MIFAFLCVLLAHSAPEPPLVVASYSYPAFDRSVALAPMADVVGHAAGRPVKIVLFDTPDALSDAVCAGQVDVAMTNLGAWVTMRDCAGVNAIAVLDTPPTVLDRYRGVLLTRADTGISGLADLSAQTETLRYSEVLPGSTSGALVQAAQLRELGVTPAHFAARLHAGTHDKSLEYLLAGEADIAALAENPWRSLQESDPARAETLRLLWRSDPLPPGPVICREREAVPCTAIGNALLEAGAAATAEALAQGWMETEGAERFRPYDEAVYAPFTSH